MDWFIVLRFQNNKRMETQQQEFSETVTVRYRCTWQEFELAVRSVGSVTASSYCKSFHVNYRGMTK